VKKVLATALILALGITGISLWGAVHAQRMAVSSSQIFIHGTPVCVMQQAGQIRAAVGICDIPDGESQDDDSGNTGGFQDETPSPHDPRLGLPPGHPPLDSIPDFEEGRKVLI